MGLKRGRSTGWSVITLGLGFTICTFIFSEADKVGSACTGRLQPTICDCNGVPCHGGNRTVPTDRLSKRFEIKKEANNTFMRYEGCISANKVYKSGEVVVDGAGPCEECICKPPEIQCLMVQCPVKTGCKIIQRSNQCCPMYQCDCEFNGKNYFNGEQIETQLDKPCEVCYCKGGEVMCTSVTCYERNDCLAKNIPGQCCPKYENCPPRKLKENGQPEKTDGNNGDDSKTKKREMQPWLLTNPAEETEKHETTEINMPTVADKAGPPSVTTEEEMTTAYNLGNDPPNNTSTEYRSPGSATPQTLHPVSGKTDPFLKIPIVEGSFESASTEINESSTKQNDDIEGKRNSDSGSDISENSTEDRITYFGSTIPQEITKFDETTFQSVLDAEATHGTTIFYMNPKVEKIETLTENQIQELEKNRTSDTENPKKFEPTTDKNNMGVKETITDTLDTARLDIQEGATTVTNFLDSKHESPSLTLKDTTETVITTNPGTVLGALQDGISVIGMQSEKADMYKTINEDERTTISILDSYETTSLVDVKQIDGLLLKDDINEKIDFQSSITDFQTEATSTVSPEPESDKLIDTVITGEGKVTKQAADVSYSLVKDYDGKSEKDSLTTLGGSDERISTMGDAQPTTFRTDFQTSLDKNKNDLMMSAQSEKMDVNTKHVTFTTEVGTVTEWIAGGLTAKMSSVSPQDIKLISTADVVTQNSSLFTTESSADTTVKISNSNEKMIDNMELKYQTTEQDFTRDIVSDIIRFDSSSILPEIQVSTIIYDATIAHDIDVPLNTDENTEMNDSHQTPLTADNLAKIEQTKEQESQSIELTESDEQTRTDHPLEFVTSLLTTTNHSKSESLHQKFQQKKEETAQIGTEANEDNISETTESLTTYFTTIHVSDQKLSGNFPGSEVKVDSSLIETIAEVQTLEAETSTNTLELIDKNDNIKVTQTSWYGLESNTNHPPSLSEGELAVENVNQPANLVNGETPTKILQENQTVKNQSVTSEEELDSATKQEANKVTNNTELIENILQQALSMQSINESQTVIQPPKFIPIEYVEKNETSEIRDETEKPKGSTTAHNKKSTISTYTHTKIEDTTEPLGDTQLVERLITKHVQNLTQIALASVANQLYDIVSKENQTATESDSSLTKIQGEIILPKDSEIERIAEEIRNATIQSFQDSFETLEEKLLEDKFNVTKTPKSTIHLTKLRIKPTSLRLRKIKGRRNKIKPKK